MQLKEFLAVLSLGLGMAPLASAAEAGLEATSIHGYVTTDWQGGLLLDDASGKNKIVPGLEQYRFVFGFLSQIGGSWVFNSEVELEHATRVGVKTSSSGGVLTSASAGLEIEIEQSWIENRRWEALRPRVGIILPPLGRTNLFHDADSFASVDRPLVDQQIIPTTWFEPGVGATGSLELGRFNLAYEAYIINGLRGTTVTAGSEAQVRDLRMHKDSANDSNTDKAAVGRLVFGFGPSAELGLSAYRGAYDPSSSLFIGYAAIDGLLRWRRFELQGEWVQMDVEAPSGAANFSKLRRGWYLQGLADLELGSWGRLQPYVQVSQVDPDAAAVTARDQTRTTLGLNFRPQEKLVFKLAYADTQVAKPYLAANGSLSAVIDQRAMAAASWGY